MLVVTLLCDSFLGALQSFFCYQSYFTFANELSRSVSFARYCTGA